MSMGDTMKEFNILAKMIAFHKTAGEITPMEFKIMGEDDVSIVKIDRVIKRTKEKSLDWDTFVLHASQP